MQDLPVAAGEVAAGQRLVELAVDQGVEVLEVEADGLELCGVAGHGGASPGVVGDQRWRPGGWSAPLTGRTDGRRAPLAVTSEGRVALEQAHRFRRAAVERVTAEWSEDELAVFARLFTRFVDGFGELRRP
ncbi:hypothetical protein [Streptomyces lydicus]|uniref:hypothetical protein n=1 Tax=Streptomyces lydicus TaxID=47763 RepID=UPI0037B016AB